MKRIVRDAMLSGEFPLWNRSYSGGQPLAPNPAYELFYPLQWLILIGRYPFGFALHIIAHVYIALAGAFLLLREMSLRRAAGFFGALSFGMGGLLLGSMPMLPTFFVWALAPIVGWSVLRVLRNPEWPRLAMAALLAGIQLIIGEPVATFQVWVLIVAGALIFGGVRALRWVALVAILATFVAAVQIVPAIDHVRNSARSRGIAFDVVKQYAMPAIRPIEIAVPHFFGKLDPLKGAFWGSAAFDRGIPYLFSIYNGMAVAILALAGFLLRARGAATVAIISIASYLLAIGDRTPLLHALYSSGIARSIRYPEKFAALGIVALTLFAATIADRFLSGDPRTRRAVITSGLLIVAINAAVLCSGVLQHAGALKRAATLEWLIGLAIAMAMTLLAWRFHLLAAFAIVLLDIVLVANDVVTRMPAPYFSAPDIVQSFDRDRNAYRVMHRSEWMNEDPNYHYVRGEFGPWFARNALIPFTAGSWGVRTALEPDFDETALLPTHDLLDALMKLGNSGYPLWAESFAAISNVRYIVDLRQLSQIVGRDRAHASLVRLTRIPSTGTYYFAERVVQTGDVVTSIRNSGLPRPTAFVSSPAPTGIGKILRVLERANSASIDVDCASDALLVITVTRDKHWRTTIDGREVPSLPVNIAYQGVVVPRGRHRVEMRYNNSLVLAGGIVSLIAVVFCAATAPIRRRRLPQSES